MIDSLVNKFYLSLVFALLLPLMSAGQTALIKGIVFDQEGQAVIGATVAYNKDRKSVV